MDLSAAFAPSASPANTERRGAPQPRESAAGFGPIMDRATAAADAKSGAPKPASRPAPERPAAKETPQSGGAPAPKSDTADGCPALTATDATTDLQPPELPATDPASNDTPPPAPANALPLPAPGSEAAALPAWLTLAAGVSPPPALTAPTDEAPLPSPPGPQGAALPPALHALALQGAGGPGVDRQPEAALGAVPLLAAEEFAPAVLKHAPQAAATAPAVGTAAPGAAAPAGVGMPTFHLPAAVESATTPPMQAAPGHPGFAQELGERILVLGHGPVKSAQIALNPGELGPIEVRVELRGQDASLVLNAAHAGTRAALEDSLPRLREMFAAQGLALGHAEVGTQARDSSGQPDRNPRQSSAGGEAGAARTALDEGPRTPARSLRGLVDTFA